MRADFQRVMAGGVKQMTEGLTGRDDVAFVSGVQVEPDITIEILFIDGLLRGFGALEIIEQK